VFSTRILTDLTLSFYQAVGQDAILPYFLTRKGAAVAAPE
jgi:hypothetical protein